MAGIVDDAKAAIVAEVRRERTRNIFAFVVVLMMLSEYKGKR